MPIGIWPVAVIPVRIPFRSPAKIELLNVASRIVANQKILSEDTAVFAYIEVEALYLESSRGFEKRGPDSNLESSGGYVRRITSLTSIIRDKYGPKLLQPTIEFEKYVLQPGAEGPNTHVLEGEIGLAWPAEAGLAAADPASDSHVDGHFAIKELDTLFLNKVQKIHHFSLTVKKTVVVKKRLKAVVGCQTMCTATADWRNQAAVIQGELNLSMHLEYEDGTLGRWSDPLSFQVPEPLVPNYAHSLYVFIDQCHVDPQLTADMDAGTDAGAEQIEITATLTGIIAETCPEAVMLYAPPINATQYYKTLRISGIADTSICCQNKALSGTVAVPGIPTGSLTHRLGCGRLEQTSGSLLQELTAFCDLFYIDDEGEKCLQVQLNDIMLTSIGEYPVTATYSGSVAAAGEPVITADLRNPGEFSVTVPLRYQVVMRETRIKDAHISGTSADKAEALSNTVGDSGEAIKARNLIRTMDVVVEEIVAQKRVRFPVEFPAQVTFSNATKHRGQAESLSEATPELDYECIPETDCCLIKGTANLASYITALDGKEVYQPYRANYCEKVMIPGCRPDLKWRCNLTAATVAPTTPADTPSLIIEADLVLYRFRRVEILAGESSAQSDQQLLALEHRLFWQSRPPTCTSAEPVRITTKADDLTWRFADDELLIIDGMVGRELYFVDRDQRLYCSDARIPFRMAALLPGQTGNIRQIRIQRVDGTALPRAKKGVPVCLEEEYHIFLEIVRQS